MLDGSHLLSSDACQNTDDGTTPQQALQNATAEWPEGARGFILGQWRAEFGGGGHIFSVVRADGGAHLVDGQINNPNTDFYLDMMRFGTLEHAALGIQILRVDDLIPTAEVLNTATAAASEEFELLDRWDAADSASALPDEVVMRERRRNTEWQNRNRELMAELDESIANPDVDPEARAQAQERRAALEYQNWALATGLARFEWGLREDASGTPGVER